MYNIKEIRQQFPMLSRNIKMQGKPLIFLDNAATTLKPQCVIDKMNEYYSKSTSNSHRADYDLAVHIDQEITETRQIISKFINCEENEVVFTSGATMSLNLLAYGYVSKFLKPGDEILLNEGEHASNLLPWFQIAKKVGAVIKFIPLDSSHRCTVENLNKVISHKTKIVSVAHVGNVLGYEIDINSFAKIAHGYGAIIVVDGSQSVPHLKVDFKKCDLDFLIFSGHKMCGPTGIGCLIGKYSLLCDMDTFMVGGGMNETFNTKGEFIPFLPPMKFEAGTLPIAEILGLKEAIKFLLSIGMDDIHSHDQELVSYAIKKLEKHPNIIIYNKDAQSSLLTFNIKGVFPQDEATLLNSKGIAVRSGMHCAKLLPSHLNTVGTVRMSTYLYTSKEDIDSFIDALINGGDILDAYFSK